MPRLQLLQQPAHSHPEVQEPTKTVLIKRDGAKFTKRYARLHGSSGDPAQLDTCSHWSLGQVGASRSSAY